MCVKQLERIFFLIFFFFTFYLKKIFVYLNDLCFSTNIMKIVRTMLLIYYCRSLYLHTVYTFFSEKFRDNEIFKSEKLSFSFPEQSFHFVSHITNIVNVKLFLISITHRHLLQQDSLTVWLIRLNKIISSYVRTRFLIETF